MPDHDDLLGAEDGLEAAKGTATIFDVLNYVVKVLKVLPDETANAWIVRYLFFGAVWEYVSAGGATDWNIIDVRNCGIRDLGLQDMG